MSSKSSQSLIYIYISFQIYKIFFEDIAVCEPLKFHKPF